MTRTRKLTLLTGLALELLLAGVVVTIIALGNRTLARGFVVYADFDRVDALKEGAHVRLSGMVIGRVLAIRQGVGPGEPRALARNRVNLWLLQAHAHHVRQSSLIYINSNGPIGERYVEIGPSPGEPLPAAPAGHLFRGADAPQMDRLIQNSYDSIHAFLAAARELGPDVTDLILAGDEVRALLAEVAPGDRLPRVQASAKVALEEARGLVATLRAGTDDLKAPLRLLGKLGALGERDGERLRALSARLDTLQENLAPLLEALGPAEQAQATSALAKLRHAFGDGQEAFALVTALLGRLEKGRGTLGRLMTDPTLNDEVKEVHRILKEGPWRAIAKPPRDHAPRGLAPRRPAGTP